MAKAKAVKKVVKKAKKPTPKVSAKQRDLESKDSIEGVLSSLPGARKEHVKEVKALANKLVAVINAKDYHPSVALDALQVVLSAGIHTVFGEEQGNVWDESVRNYHSESNMRQILNLFKEIETMGQGEESSATPMGPGALEPTPEA